MFHVKHLLRFLFGYTPFFLNDTENVLLIEQL